MDDHRSRIPAFGDWALDGGDEDDDDASSRRRKYTHEFALLRRKPRDPPSPHSLLDASSTSVSSLSPSFSPSPGTPSESATSPSDVGSRASQGDCNSHCTPTSGISSTSVGRVDSNPPTSDTQEGARRADVDLTLTLTSTSALSPLSPAADTCLFPQWAPILPPRRIASKGKKGGFLSSIGSSKRSSRIRSSGSGGSSISSSSSGATLSPDFPESAAGGHRGIDSPDTMLPPPLLPISACSSSNGSDSADSAAYAAAAADSADAFIVAAAKSASCKAGIADKDVRTNQDLPSHHSADDSSPPPPPRYSFSFQPQVGLSAPGANVGGASPAEAAAQVRQRLRHSRSLRISVSRQLMDSSNSAPSSPVSASGAFGSTFGSPCAPGASATPGRRGSRAQDAASAAAAAADRCWDDSSVLALLEHSRLCRQEVVQLLGLCQPGIPPLDPPAVPVAPAPPVAPAAPVVAFAPVTRNARTVRPTKSAEARAGGEHGADVLVAPAAGDGGGADLGCVQADGVRPERPELPTSHDRTAACMPAPIGSERGADAGAQGKLLLLTDGGALCNSASASAAAAAAGGGAAGAAACGEKAKSAGGREGVDEKGGATGEAASSSSCGSACCSPSAFELTQKGGAVNEAETSTVCGSACCLPSRCRVAPPTMSSALQYNAGAEDKGFSVMFAEMRQRRQQEQAAAATAIGAGGGPAAAAAAAAGASSDHTAMQGGNQVAATAAGASKNRNGSSSRGDGACGSIRGLQWIGVRADDMDFILKELAESAMGGGTDVAVFDEFAGEEKETDSDYNEGEVYESDGYSDETSECDCSEAERRDNKLIQALRKAQGKEGGSWLGGGCVGDIPEETGRHDVATVEGEKGRRQGHWLRKTTSGTQGVLRKLRELVLGRPTHTLVSL